MRRREEPILWQPVQWQAIVTNGGPLILIRTCPQRQPPSRGRFHLLIAGLLRLIGSNHLTPGKAGHFRSLGKSKYSYPACGG